MPKVVLDISDELLEFATWAAESFGYFSARDFLAGTLNTAILAAMDESPLVLPYGDDGDEDHQAREDPGGGVQLAGALGEDDEDDLPF